MKKLLLVTCLFFISFTAFSQENTIKNRIDNFDSITAPVFADSIAYSAKTPYEFLKRQTTRSRNELIYVYIPSNLTDQERKDQLDLNCDKCMRVNFDVYAQRLVFRNVQGSFLDLYPTWQREFFAEATPEQTIDDIKFRMVFKGNKTLFAFREEHDYWEIRNY